MRGDSAPPVIDARADGVADRVAGVLAEGGLVVLPTDTVYGVAALAARPDATGAIFASKGRAADVPVAVLCADATQAFALAAQVTSVASALAERHWPGPLTLVMHRRADLDWSLGEPTATIGVRCPDHALVRSVARRLGPLAVTSANRHGEATPPTAVAAAASLVGPVDLVVDGGELAGTASTVVDVTGDVVSVLRHGDVDVDVDGDVSAFEPPA